VVGFDGQDREDEAELAPTKGQLSAITPDVDWTE
jgi:hypothetical protein